MHLCVCMCTCACMLWGIHLLVFAAGAVVCTHVVVCAEQVCCAL